MPHLCAVMATWMYSFLNTLHPLLYLLICLCHWTASAPRERTSSLSHQAQHNGRHCVKQLKVASGANACAIVEIALKFLKQHHFELLHALSNPAVGTGLKVAPIFPVYSICMCDTSLESLRLASLSSHAHLFPPLFTCVFPC